MKLAAICRLALASTSAPKGQLSPRIDLSQGGWVRSAASPPPYDATTCWLMKARYNCDGDSRPEQALAYRYVQRLADGLKSAPGRGHGGQLLPLHRALKLVRSMGDGRGRVNMLMVGHSYLRQVFEALACRWRDNVTAGILSVGPPRVTAMTQAALKKLAGEALDPRNRELEWFNASGEPPACHGSQGASGNFGGYYAPDHAPLQAFTDCVDDVAMIELDGNLRIYYIFRPYTYKTRLRELLNSVLGLAYAAVDVVVHLNGFEGNAALKTLLLAELRAARSAAGHRPPFVLEFGPVRETLKAQLLAAMNRTWRGGEPLTLGARNCRLWNDAHPCLPGIPDDEVDLLFRALEKRAKFVHGGKEVNSSVIIKQVEAAAREEPARTSQCDRIHVAVAAAGFSPTMQDKLRFFHVPKAGSSFAPLIWAMACDADNKSLALRIVGGRTIPPPGVRGTLCAAHYLGGQERIMPDYHHAGLRGGGDAAAAVGVFREPASRIVSAYHYGYHTHPNLPPVVLKPLVALPEANATRLVAFARLRAVRNTATKMLLGELPGTPWFVTATEVALSLRRLSAFRFIAITECLDEAADVFRVATSGWGFAGTLPPLSFSRQHKSSNYAKQRVHDTAAVTVDLLRRGRDTGDYDADVEVYDAAACLFHCGRSRASIEPRSPSCITSAWAHMSAACSCQ